MRRSLIAGLAALVFGIPAIALVAQTPPGKGRARAELPKSFPNSEGIYFKDAFKDAVVGARPDFGKPAANVAGSPTAPNTPMATAGGTESAGSGAAWSQIISATTIEDEIKASKKIMDEEVSTPAKFAGNGYKVARKQFSVLASMFAIIGEYDSDVRWKADGPAARDLFARTAANCKVGTIQVFNEAKQRKVDLEDLLSGAGVKNRTGEATVTWPQVTDRSPLMQRLETSHQERMQPWVANKSEFSDHAEEMFHEAQLTAALAEILMKEGMEDGDDDDYREFCQRLKKAALEIGEAVKSNNYDKARAAVGEIGQSCSGCHESYR